MDVDGAMKIAERIICETEIPYVPESDSVNELAPHWDPLIDTIAQALLAASKPASGFVRTDDGVDIKIGKGAPKTADGAYVILGVNYYTQDINTPGSPVVGCGVIECDIGDSATWEISVRTDDGGEFNTWPDKIFVSKEAALKAAGEVKG